MIEPIVDYNITSTYEAENLHKYNSSTIKVMSKIHILIRIAQIGTISEAKFFVIYFDKDIHIQSK